MSTVLLTGASGFLGAHTTRALLDDGHRVRAFVRTPGKLATSLAAVGVAADDERIEVAEGVMTDEAAVGSAVSGCDAAIHAAATYSMKRADAERMRSENERGTALVLDAAIAAGVRHVVHVSSTVALTRPGGAVLDHTSPVGAGLGPYSRSKVASELVARTRQAQGAPVSIANPGGIVGPGDVALGETNASIKEILSGRLPAYPRGGVQWVDVRDVAAVLVAALAHEPGGRYLVPGSFVARPHDVLSEVTGRRLPMVAVPGALAAALAAPGYYTGWSFLPGAREGARTLGCGNRVDARHTEQTLGVHARPLTEAVRDTLRWMVDAGQLPAGQAGAAVG